MFRKYEKTFRINTPNIKVNGKLNLSSREKQSLLTGKVIIEEKMDGANVGIVRSNKGWTLQKRRGLADEGIHEQFSFFWQWARHNDHKIMSIPKGFIVYGELLYATHHVYYDRLPSYFLAFDIWDGNKYFDFNHKTEALNTWGFCTVPVLGQGYFDTGDLDKLMYRTSTCASVSQAEGIVVKNYKKQMRAKLVRPEFMKNIEDEGHWMHRSTRRNKLAEGASVYA